MRFAAACALMIALTNSLPAQDPVPVMDLHSDVLLRAIDNGVDLGEDNGWTQATLPNLEAGHVTEQVFAVWVDSYDLSGLDAFSRAMRMIGVFQQQAERHSDRMALAHTMAEAREIVDSGRIASFLWLEGGAPIMDDPAMLAVFKDQGVSGMTLTWTNNLPWAGSSTDHGDPEMGLTDLGREIVAEMNRLGMIVDLSHVSNQTFADALAISTDPVIVSHSCCSALFDHPRNVNDELLRALAENGGVICINLYSGYISPTWEAGWDATAEALSPEIAAIQARHGGRTIGWRAERCRLIGENLPPESRVSLDMYLDHIEHAIEVAGPEHVGLGSDFDGIWAFPEGLENPANWQRVAEGLRARGHSEEVIQGVMGGNARRVFEAVLDR